MNTHPNLLRIAEIGHPVIRTVCKPIENPLDPDIQKFVADLHATCVDQDALGLAACQVYRPLRIIVIASAVTPDYPKAPNMRPLVMINPELLYESSIYEDGWEGCKSIPNIRAKVARAVSVKVEYIDRTGKTMRRRLYGLPARIFLHELDHLNGVVFLDKANLDTLTTYTNHTKYSQKKR